MSATGRNILSFDVESIVAEVLWWPQADVSQGRVEGLLYPGMGLDLTYGGWNECSSSLHSS